MAFEWNPAKDIENRKQHGLGFADFEGFDAEPLVIEDDRRDYGETRYRAFGRINGVGHCLVFTMRGETMRLISFRRAHEKEMRRYDK